jgi:hypothetical protein
MRCLKLSHPSKFIFTQFDGTKNFPLNLVEMFKNQKNRADKIKKTKQKTARLSHSGPKPLRLIVYRERANAETQREMRNAVQII